MSSRFAEAWNQHDSKTLASFWADDGDLLSPWSGVISGRKAIEEHFAEEQLDKLKDSKLQLTLQNVRMIDPDVAFLDADFTISGMTVGGVKADPFHDHGIFLLVKRDGKWQVLIARAY